MPEAGAGLKPVRDPFDKMHTVNFSFGQTAGAGNAIGARIAKSTSVWWAQPITRNRQRETRYP